ncbi:eukaryotic translation initiation factor 3 subunit C-like [Oscarella lobularis]|uniref:eukaryotic translation initiation factor 3 subunit C-like n=1 Tax=Oscarella lobularis TaxID=121494 RepID=UPI0033141534
MICKNSCSKLGKTFLPKLLKFWFFASPAEDESHSTILFPVFSALKPSKLNLKNARRVEKLRLIWNNLRASLWLCNSLFSRNRKNDCLLLALLWARLLLLSRDISFFALTRFTCKREKMSRFFARRGDDSASSSDSDEEEATPMRGGISQKTAAIYLSDDEEDVKRVVRSQKDKRYEEFADVVKNIKNSRKIKDVAKVAEGFESLTRIRSKAQAVIEKEGKSPRIFIKTLAELEDFVQELWEEKKKLSRNNFKALTMLRQKVRKYNKDHEKEISEYRENPGSDHESESELEEEEEVGQSDKEEKEEEEEEDQTGFEEVVSKKKRKAELEEESEDSIDWESSSSETDSGDEGVREGGGFMMLTHEFFLKSRTSGKVTQARRKRDKGVDKDAGQTAAEKGEENEEGWEKVQHVTVKEKSLFAKDAEINHEAVLQKLAELLAVRGRRGTDRSQLTEQLEKLTQISKEQNLGAALEAKLLISIITSMFDYSVKMQACMKLEIWQKCLACVKSLIILLNEHSEVRILESITEEEENVHNAQEEYQVRGSVLMLLEKLDDEYRKILLNTDPHSTEYVDRLVQENNLVALIDLVKCYVEQRCTPEEICRIYLRTIEHAYYKFDRASLSKEEKDVGGSDGSPTKELLSNLSEMCKRIYSESKDGRVRTRALLCHVYFCAIHGHWHEARDLMLMSHLQDSIQEADVPTQILYNRTTVQLGLCAFRQGLIRDAHFALFDVQTSGRAKELLAQGLMAQKYGERSAEQEKIEKRRLMPFHMHINLELLEFVYLTSAMLLEIPNMAAHEFDHRKQVISKAFRYHLRVSERSPLVGPPESMREHVVAAANAMKKGNWKACNDYMMDVKVWTLFPNPQKVKGMLTKKIKEESLRTYLFAYSSVYDSLSISTLSEMFELEPSAIQRILSKMMITEELQASWDEPTSSVVLHHAEPTRLQSIALHLADKVGSLIEQNERVMEMRYGSRIGQSSHDRQSGAQQQSSSAKSRLL